MEKFKIETNRLILQNIELSELKNYHKLCTNTQITKHLSYIKTKNLEETKKWIMDKIKWNKETPRKSYNLSIFFKRE